MATLTFAASLAALPIMLGAPAAAISSEAVCTATGYSIDPDVSGLNVRETASSKAKTLGKIFTITDETGLVSPHSAILDIKDGWVVISRTDPLTESGAVSKKNYTDTGWVALSKFAGHMSADDISSPKNKSYSGPGENNRVIDPDGLTNALNMQKEFGSLPKLLDCRDKWIKQEYRQSGALNAKGKWVRYSKAERDKRRPVQAWFYSGAKY